MASEPGAGALLYVDTSALVKLVVREPESEAVEAELDRWADGATSTVTRIELPRVVARRHAEVERPDMVLGILAGTNEVPFDETVLKRAIEVRPPELGTLDAIHLASALSLGEDLGGLLSYDRRLLEAAAAASLPTLAPT